MNNNEIIKNICFNLDSNKSESLRLITEEYPFKEIQYEERRKTVFQKTKIFVRDGFIDRYSGNKLIFPPVLRIISNNFPEEFPYHKNWDMKKCHISYWELTPTLDHIIPIARGGSNSDDNIVCTSMLRNSAKANFILEEVGWSIQPAGDLHDWDGMIFWYIEYIDRHRSLLDQTVFASWYNAAVKCLR